jgi:hypothetical protein
MPSDASIKHSSGSFSSTVSNVAVMSKLSEPLKALINASHARPNTLPAPRHIASVYERVANGAKEKGVGLKAWLTASVSILAVSMQTRLLMMNNQAAATFTLNSPDSLLELYRVANDAKFKRNESHGVWTAELMREIGLKCIGLNGVCRRTTQLRRVVAHSTEHRHRYRERLIALELSTAAFLRTFARNSTSDQPGERYHPRR